MILITGGCSFSTPGYGTWVDILPKNVKFEKVVHTGSPALSNHIIQRRVMYAIVQQLEFYDPSEILVLVMWSGHNRDAYLTKDGEYLSPSTIESHVGPVLKDQMTDLNKDPADLGYIYWTPHSSAIHERLTEKLYKFSNEFDSWDRAVNCMITLQNFCSVTGVNYYWTTFTDEWIEFFNMNIDKSKHSTIGWLLNILDYDICLSEKGMYNWCMDHVNHSVNTHGEGFHPSHFAHTVYTDQVIIPYLESKNILTK